MQLNRTSLKKLIREHLSGDAAPPLPAEAIDTALSTLREELLAIAGVSDESTRFHQNVDMQRVHYFGIREPGTEESNRWTGYAFGLGVNSDRVLCVCLNYHYWQPLADGAGLCQFVRAYQAGLQRRRAKANKQQKLRDLKSQAMIAQIKNLAKEEAFDFYTQIDRVKLKLHIRLSETQELEIRIPFSKFQTILPQIREAVKALRTVHQAGIQFKIARSDRYPPWTLHQDL